MISPQLNVARPYCDEDVPPVAIWRYIDATTVNLADLIPTQYYLVIDRLMCLAGGGPCDGLDTPHVMSVGSKLYLHDGHHRWALAILHGATSLQVKIHYL